MMLVLTNEQQTHYEQLVLSVKESVIWPTRRTTSVREAAKQLLMNLIPLVKLKH